MNADILIRLNEVVKSRKLLPADDSYTCKLFTGGDNKIIKKLGEENAEFIRSLLTQSDEDIAGEAADYIYHMIVALRYKDIDFEEVLKVLSIRHGE